MSDHAFRVYKALRYIDQNLFAPIDLQAIASAGAFSSFHFHRVFTSLMGVSVGDYVRRRRLAEAAQRLLHSDQDILDLALECQYESQEAFTRAFKAKYEITPGQLRKVKKSITVERPLTMDDLEQLVKGDVMNPAIETRPAMRLIGVAQTYENHNFQKSYQHWGEFVRRVREIQCSNDHTMVGISMTSHPDVLITAGEKYIYMTAVEAKPDSIVPAGMIELKVPAQTYAKFVHRGHVVDYLATYRKIWNHWIPETRIEVIDGPEIEIYDERFKLDSPESEFDLLVPIRG
jgi:AraC family transcriptional regulator